ncbi:hypothetical protein [Pseudomonas sp. NPDC090592]|uniref:hypothetical protein n=1 Tax=Pseudomonas sp. NPDC090592 TaxID=3364480 RepID=UPI00383ABDAF
MPDCQSGAVHSLVCGTIICMAVAGDIGVCHADCHEGDCCKALCDQGCSSVRSARLFPEERDGRRLAQYSAKRIGAGQRGTVYLAHERYMCKSIHHMGSDRARCRMRIAFGENQRENGVTLKVRVTWVLSKTAFATSVLRLWIVLVNALIFKASGFVHEIIHRWKSVVSEGFVSAFSFAKRGPSKQGGFAALFGWTRIKSGQR